MITTKDQKQKLVVQCMASVGSAYILWIYPEMIAMRLIYMV